VVFARRGWISRLRPAWLLAVPLAVLAVLATSTVTAPGPVAARAAAPYAVTQVQALPVPAMLRWHRTPPPLAAGLRRQVVRFRVGGLLREYVEVSAVHPHGPQALVLVLHGRRQSAWRAEATQHWDAVARAGLAVVVYGAGWAGSWDAGSCCGKAARQQVDDVGYLTSVVHRVEATHLIDRQRVDLAGFSNGGMMAYRFACARADLVSAVAVVAGSLQVSDCHPARPISVLDVQGDRDPVVPFRGSRFSWFAGSPITSIPQSLAPWRRVDRGTREVVRLLGVPGLRHDWPTERNADLDATALIWRFFRSHPLVVA